MFCLNCKASHFLKQNWLHPRMGITLGHPHTQVDAICYELRRHPQHFFLKTYPKNKIRNMICLSFSLWFVTHKKYISHFDNILLSKVLEYLIHIYLIYITNARVTINDMMKLTIRLCSWKKLIKQYSTVHKGQKKFNNNKSFFYLEEHNGHINSVPAQPSSKTWQN